MAQKYTFTAREHAMPLLLDGVIHSVGVGHCTCAVDILLHGVDQPFCLAVGANIHIAESRAARIAALLNEGWSK